MKTISILLMFISCMSYANGGQCVADSPTPSHGTAEQPKEKGTTSEVVQHFWFEYEAQPEPGRRVWVHVDDSTWTELYPSGALSRYKIGDRTTVRGMIGTIARKVSGDPNRTWTLNDGSFEVFIPDKNNVRLIIAFRHYQNGQWTEWQPLAIIHPID